MARTTNPKRAVNTPAVPELKTRVRKQPERYGFSAVTPTTSKVTKKKPVKRKGGRVKSPLVKNHTRRASTGREVMPEAATSPGEAVLLLNADVRSDGSSPFWKPFFTGVADIRWAWFLWRLRYFLRTDGVYKDQEGVPIVVTGPATRSMQRGWWNNFLEVWPRIYGQDEEGNDFYPPDR